ncbi:sugar phosphate isomerase/epimerase family protein [Paenibacillus chungangensis]|uniref:Sugar phosphate isomerase/epimerase family protein n=1 Tax=Paenibacillus chungangensis TaxID=696535 RepID=A0ABW3HU80_9BACL
MIRGLTRAGVGDIGNDKDFIEKASQYGFQAVDIDPLRLIKQYGIEGSRELLLKYHMQIGCFGIPVDWQSDEATFRQGLQRLIECAAAAADLGVNKCGAYILPSNDQRALPFLIKATKRLRLCAEILGEYNIQLALEFVGSHHLRTQWKYPFIWRLDDTLEWIDMIGSSNVGLLFDSYHWHTNGLNVSDIIKLRRDQIVHVHINDAYDLPIEDLLDHERIYPGDGIIDLVGFLQSLKVIGYEGVVSQEVISSNKNQDALTLLKKTKDAFDYVFAQI